MTHQGSHVKRRPISDEPTQSALQVLKSLLGFVKGEDMLM